MPVQALVLEENNGIVTAGSCLDQSLRVLRIARENDVPTRRVRIHRFHALRVERSAFNPAATRHAHDDRIRPRTVATPAKGRDLVPHLHESWPGVIRELNFDDRLISANG